MRLVLVGLLLVTLLETGAFLQRYGGAPAGASDCVVRVSPTPEPTGPRRVAEAYPAWLSQQRGTVNDASCLNRTPVYGVARPRSADELRRALRFAQSHGLSVAVAGTQHSMGGQASHPRALVLDMREMAGVAVDDTASTVRAGAGATWRQVLESVHDHGLAVTAMPSIDVLSVGGTLSVNAHGADFRTGSLASTVRSLTVMTADGTVRTIDREHGGELFRAVLGGYGLFGVILEAELDLVPSEMYRLRQRTVPTADFVELFERSIVPDERNRLMYAHLSTSPSSFLDEAIVYTYERLDTAEPVPPLREDQDSGVARLVLNVARHGGMGQRVKWASQKHLLPRVRACHESRNEALRAAEACLVSRNQAMYNGLGLLRNRLTRYTDVLQEYFLAPDQLTPFLQEARETLRSHDAQLLSASIRVVHDADVTLDYARGDRLSVVLYLSQEVSAAGNRDMAELNRALIESALRHEGTFYLPYQQHYTQAQLRRAYPMVDDFFALKRRHDPGLLFMNGFYATYAAPRGSITGAG